MVLSQTEGPKTAGSPPLENLKIVVIGRREAWACKFGRSGLQVVVLIHSSS